MFIDAYFNSLDALETLIQKPLIFFGLCLRDTEDTSALITSIMHEMRCSPQTELSKRVKYLSWTERYQSRF